jgi:hypothetical protein
MATGLVNDRARADPILQARSANPEGGEPAAEVHEGCRTVALQTAIAVQPANEEPRELVLYPVTEMEANEGDCTPSVIT